MKRIDGRRWGVGSTDAGLIVVQIIAGQKGSIDKDLENTCIE